GVGRRDARPTRTEPDDADGAGAVGGRPVPDFAVAVLAPTFQGVRGGHRAGVRIAGGDGGDPAGEAGDVHGGQAFGGGAVPDLAVAVVAPALHAARGGEGAGVVVAGGDGRDAAGEAGNVDRGRADGQGAVPELAVAVVAPALHTA